MNKNNMARQGITGQIYLCVNTYQSYFLDLEKEKEI